jgi:ABC-type branched-subunit amino acid transport system ATPase component
MLSIHKLSYCIGNSRILDEIEGTVEAGELVALIGPNGAGKSTLADIICGYRKPLNGRILLAGTDITHTRPHIIARLGIARMFQGAHLAWNLTAKENILAALPDTKDFDSRTKNRDAHALFLLERVGLLGKSKEFARRLSFGQQRLLALARILARPTARTLILDEPFSGLKGAALEQIMTLILDELRSGKAVLIIDHLLSALQDLNCQFWYLNGGHVTAFPGLGALSESELFISGYGASDSKPKKTRERLERATSPVQTKRSICAIFAAKLGYPGRTVVKHAEFKAYSHEAIAVVGLNGSGKSTLLRAIAGTCPLLEGRVEFLGEDVTLMPVHQRVQRGLRALPQDHRLFRELSVYALTSLQQASTVLRRSF